MTREMCRKVLDLQRVTQAAEMVAEYAAEYEAALLACRCDAAAGEYEDACPVSRAADDYHAALRLMRDAM